MAVQAPPQSSLQTRPVATSAGTMTATAAESGPSRTSLALASSGTLRLRAVSATDRHIQWAEDVIDNEGMGKKSSKVCCIYHAPRAYDESSDESSSSDESDSESEADNSTARASGRYTNGVGRGSKHGHHHHDHNSTPGSDHGNSSKGKAKARASSPNAYEKMPKHQGTKKQRP